MAGEDFCTVGTQVLLKALQERKKKKVKCTSDVVEEEAFAFSVVQKSC